MADPALAQEDPPLKRLSASAEGLNKIAPPTDTPNDATGEASLRLKRAKSDGNLRDKPLTGSKVSLVANLSAGENDMSRPLSDASPKLQTSKSWKAKFFSRSRSPSALSSSHGSTVPASPVLSRPLPFAKYGIDEASVTALYHTLSKAKLPMIRPYDSSRSISIFSPEVNLWEHKVEVGDELACGSTSTYPTMPGKKERDGDPIADRFVVQLQDFGSLTVVALADGCNWGAAAREAATIATKSFVAYINANQHHITDSVSAGYHLVSAFSVANENISAGCADLEKCGTTTLFGGFVLPLSSDKWTLYGAAVGDCKVYYYSASSNKVKDITEGSRENVSNGSDPGGRLGPAQRPEGSPDLRNLRTYSQTCKNGDLLLFSSDGVADNLDPRHLGMSPKDVHLDRDNWSDKGDPVEDEAQTKYTEQNLRDNFILVSSNPKEKPKMQPVSEIVSKLLQHCQTLTQKSRDWMLSNPNRRLPRDYKQFPGKMDHATIIALKLQPFKRPISVNTSGSIPYFQRKVASSSNEGGPPNYQQVSTQFYQSSYTIAHPDIVPSDFQPRATGLHSTIPSWPVRSLTPEETSVELVAENLHDGSKVSFGDFVCCALASSFPQLPNKPKREGSPISDRVFVQLRKQPVMFFGAVDGSGWGKAASDASDAVIQAFRSQTSIVLPPQQSLPDLSTIGQALIDTLIPMQTKIAEGVHDVWEAGTASFMGGVVVPLDAKKDPSKFVPSSLASSAEPPEWAVLCINVGANRLYHYSAALKKVTDVTGAVVTSFETLARLGPATKPHAQPDLRNLSLQCLCGNSGDLILVLSDGITDNLHPQYYGYAPTHFSLTHSDWSVDNSDPVERDIVTTFAERFLEKILHQDPTLPPPTSHRSQSFSKLGLRPSPAVKISDRAIPCQSAPSTVLVSDQTSSYTPSPPPVSASFAVDRSTTISSSSQSSSSTSSSPSNLEPDAVVKHLLNHVLELTRAGREYFAGAQKQLPKNHTAITGRMDHAAVIAIRLPTLEEYNNATQKADAATAISCVDVVVSQ